MTEEYWIFKVNGQAILSVLAKEFATEAAAIAEITDNLPDGDYAVIKM